MKKRAIERLSSIDDRMAADYFASGPAEPRVFSAEVVQWPALEKWDLDFFAEKFGKDFGKVLLSFNRNSGARMTQLGAFIEHLGEPTSEIPGFWLGPDQRPAMDAPEYSEERVWSFAWDPFRKHPDLLEDIQPFPFEQHNITANLPDDLYTLFQSITGIDFRAIYISRKGTVTPLHADFHDTIGCLVQFVGRKEVRLVAPEDYAKVPGEPFNPESPDFAAFPQMKGRSLYTAELQPGDMLIIPPGWWHHTRSLEHAMILSHNFFNQHNFTPFVRNLLKDMLRMKDSPENLARIGAKIEAVLAQAEAGQDN